MEEPVDAILIGAGQRGTEVYGEYARRHPDQLRFVAVAEPNPERRERFAGRHGIPADRRFLSWEPLLAEPQLGQAALICTQDRLHAGPALAAMQAGYHVLLEKPMATTPEDCRRLVQASQRTGRQLHICHVLRYTRHFRQMRQIVRSGELGQVVTVSHRENVSYWHMAHSYVRGHWSRAAESSPLILAKCCHDFDLLLWILEAGPLSLSSVGSLTHFRPENAPEGAPEYCLDGCPASEACPYYAPFIYIDQLPLWRTVAATANGLPRMAAQARASAPAMVGALRRLAPPLQPLVDYDGWPLSVVSPEPTPEDLREALRRGPYGRCVYHGANDVVDHQLVILSFENGITASLGVSGHAHVEGRTTRIQGSRAELTGVFGAGGARIKVREHRTGRHRRLETGARIGRGHGGGDDGLMAAFVRGVREGGEEARTTAEMALLSHLLAFAAETARLEGRVLGPEAWE